MSTAAIVVVCVVGALVLLMLGGAVATARRNRRRAAHFARRVEAANAQLAAAAADDRGWDRETLETVARRAWTEAHDGDEVLELALVSVIDLPGTDEDRAVFEVTGRHASGRVTLVRAGGEWQAEPPGTRAVRADGAA